MKHIFLVVLFILGATVMLINSGCSGDYRYSEYSSKDADIGIKMDYPFGWKDIERKGAYGSFAQVQFVEPDAEGHELRATMVATVKKSKDLKFKPQTVEAAAEDIISKRLKMNDSRLISDSDKRLFGQNARYIELSYKALVDEESIKERLCPVKEKIIIFRIEDKFYFLRYLNTKEEFNKFDKAFYHCVKSIRFK
jgi:hypothetical protein